MEAITTSLTTSLTPATFFGVVGDLIPFIVIMIPVALGFTMLKKMLKGASKAKVQA